MNEYKESRRGDSRQKITGKGRGIKERIVNKECKAASNSTKSQHVFGYFLAGLTHPGLPRVP